MKYTIPVTYLCLDTIEIEADSLEDAINAVHTVSAEVENTMVQLNSSYVNKSVRVDDGLNGDATLANAVAICKEFNKGVKNEEK